MNKTSAYTRTFRIALISLLFAGACELAGPGLLRAVSSNEGSVRLLEDGDYFPAFIKTIDGAKSEIVMSFFLFKTNGYRASYTDRLLAGLVRAAKRGVRVRIILDQRETGSHADTSNRETAARLRQAGIEVDFDSPGVTTHTKVAVIDERYILLGSHNLTNSALKYNHELSVFIDSPPLAGKILRYIESLRK